MIAYVLRTLHPIPVLALITVIVLAVALGVFIGYAWGWLDRGRSDADRRAERDARQRYNADLNMQRSEVFAPKKLAPAKQDHHAPADSVLRATDAVRFGRN